MKHLYTYDEMINESFFSKTKSLVDNMLGKLSRNKVEDLKMALIPYKGLSKDEIENKIKDQIDPYGEEEWDETKENERVKRKKVLNILYHVFGGGFLISLGPTLFSFFIETINILGSEGKVPPNTTLSVFSSITLASFILFVLSKKLYNRS
jgi:hypothetical protein